MFVSAIEEVSKFTRPVHFVTRYYGSHVGVAGSGTIFFVNESGVAITCKHVVDLFSNIAPIRSKYQQFKLEKSGIPKTKQYDRRLTDLETKYQYSTNNIIDILANFIDATTDNPINFNVISHPTHDLSILIFQNFKNARYSSHAVFAKDSSGLKQGKFLCRLGYPFPEFRNFEYDPVSDQLRWTNTGFSHAPRFPIDGMVTRHLYDGTHIFGVELSTPGLKGQSGGPLFDTNGLVYGMQFMTKHLHLGFDMKNREIISDGKNIKVNNQPFLHVGHCIHVDIIKDFLRQHHVHFYEK